MCIDSYSLDIYDLTLTMTCNQGVDDIFDTSDVTLDDNMYRIDLNIFIESEYNNNYEDRYKASRDIFAINKFVQTPSEAS